MRTESVKFAQLDSFYKKEIGII